MTEQKLKEYFENTLSAKLLSLDLKGSQKQTCNDVTTVYIDSLKDGEFQIKKEHLLRLCGDVILGEILPSDLNTISFALISSDFFYWDNETIDGALIARVVFDWDNPEICFALTLDNVQLWREYLLTGLYKLGKTE